MEIGAARRTVPRCKRGGIPFAISFGFPTGAISASPIGTPPSPSSPPQRNEQASAKPAGGGTPPAPSGTPASAPDDSSWATRGWGALKALGGGLEAAGGVVFGAATFETGAGAVIGGAVAIHGADSFVAGLEQLWTGNEYRTQTSQLAQAGAEFAGVDPNTARRFGDQTDAALGILGAAATGGTSALGTGAKLALAAGGAQDAAAVVRLAPALTAVGSAAATAANVGTIMSQQGSGAGDSAEEEFSKLPKGKFTQRKPGKLGQFKGTDALRAENNVVRAAAKAAGLSKDQARQLHDRVSGQGLSFKEILEIANELKGG